MSTELKPVSDRNGTVYLTQYSGGKENGLCLQITPSPLVEYLSLTKADALALATALLEWVQDKRPSDEG